MKKSDRMKFSWWTFTYKHNGYKGRTKLIINLHSRRLYEEADRRYEFMLPKCLVRSVKSVVRDNF